ncbi:MAG: response regulator [Prevotella sp.]|nr:response regulator [Prevotella sp.]
MKHVIWILTISVALVIGGQNCWAIDANLVYYFTHLDNRNGLSENDVKSIVQDRWGLIWLGTKNGLDRYDGRQLKHYDVTDFVVKRGNHNISALMEDTNGQLWVGTDKGIFVFNPIVETFTSFDMTSQDNKQIRNWIAEIKQDGDGNIWIVSPLEGVFRYNTDTNSLQRYATRRQSDDATFDPQSMCIRADGDVWIGTAGQGLFLLDPQTGRMKQYSDGILGQDIYKLTNYGEWILVGEHEGQLKKFNPQTGELRQVEATNVHYKIIRAIDYYDNNIYVATQDGLYIINEQQHTEQRLCEGGIIPNTLSDNMLYTLYRDRDGGLWIGTMQSGVNYMPPRGIHFYSYIPTGLPGSLSNKHIREMQCDGNGDIWISMEEGHINVFHPNLQIFEKLPTPQYKGGTNRLALMVDGDNVWSGLFKNGLDIISVKTHKIKHFSPEQLGLRGEGSVYALFKDRDANIWLGTAKGVYIRSNDMRFNKVTAIPDVFVQDIVQDLLGNIWVSTIGSGVFRYDVRSGRTQQYLSNTNSVSSNDVSSISIDHQGRLWFATDRGGICTYNPNTKKWQSWSREDGLPDDVTYKVLEDSLHRLWFGTNHGLVCGNIEENITLVYLNSNGLPGNQYNYKSAAVGADGTFYFGGTQGIVAFNPMLAGKDQQGRVLITNLRVDRRDILPGESDILESNIIEAKEIHLPYDFSSFSLSISSLNYRGVEGDSYEYQLSGVDNSWILVRNNDEDISFSRLQPGTYLFRVRPAGGIEVTELRVIVAYPWWLSPIMKFFYFVLLVIVAYAIFRFMQFRQRQKEKERQERFVEEKDKELLQSKINFFTDITHEIRTPLTLINGSVENMNEQQVDSLVLQKDIKAIGKNTKRLLNLINQLLDFRKVESNSMTLSFVNINLNKMLTSIVERFEPAICRMNKTISLDIETEDIVLQADSEAMTKMISNLLNNARKYSESFIQVSVRSEGDQLFIHVINDGPKIPADKAEYIFKPFTQLDNTHVQSGSGLGLSMARSLAEMHGGSLSINMRSEYNDFELVLPLKQEHVIDMQNMTELSNSSADTVLDNIVEDNSAMIGNMSHEYTILVVEDNEEVMQMIVDGLSPHYHVMSAKDGVQGLAMTHRDHVDLIVSDIMMPEMDGLEMCRRLKDDMETSHIPVVMLTARQTLDNRLEGLRAGADAYIEKPFSFAHLLTQIETLLQNRQRERESFVKRPYLPVQSSGISKVEEQFISHITEKIIKNIQQPEFNVEQLAAEMCMSRSSLHRKIKEVSDMTPIDFIRLIRLKKAAELIREKGYRSNEVCEMVGINSPSYFIKLFQKQFGMTPKEFAMKKD